MTCVPSIAARIARSAGIADADGLENAAFTYQWLAGDSDISGATGSTYTLADADEGKAIKVQVSFTDDARDERAFALVPHRHPGCARAHPGADARTEA